MAKSGYVEAKVTNYNTLRFEWEETKQSIDLNYSTINWRLKLVSGAYGEIQSSALKDCTVTVNGTAFSDKVSIAILNNTYKVLLNNSLTIPHNADGTKVFSISFGVNFNIIFGAKHIGHIIGAGSGTLNSIPRPAQITGVSNTTDEDSPTIRFTNSAGSLATSLMACISSTGISDDIAAYREIDKTKTSYSFNLTDAEKQKIWARAGDSDLASVKFHVKTVLNGSTYYDSFPTTISIVPSPPTATYRITETNSLVSALTGGTRFVDGYSDIEYDVDAQAYKGARVHSIFVTHSGETKNTDVGIFHNSKDSPMIIKVVDTRFKTREYRPDIDYVGYVDLTCSLSDVRLEATNTLYFTISGNYFNGNFGSTNNSLILKYRYKEVGGSYTNWVNVTPTFNTSAKTYKINVVLNNINYANSYIIQVNAQDELKSVEDSKEVNSVPVFDWSEDDFNFNVPVKIHNIELPYIVSEGTSDIWTYRKWSDGTSECWGRKTLPPVNVSNVWGGLYVTGIISSSNIAYPQELFKNIPSLQVSLETGSTGGMLIVPGGAGLDTTDEKQTGVFEIARGTSITSAYYTINYYARGRWE